MLRSGLILLFLSYFSDIGADEKNWWKYTEIYEVYIRSFKDTNGDGIGDLKGVTSKLDYIEGLHVDSIWVSPFYESPMVDMGYDISDFKKVDPIFGTLEDFQELCREATKRGIKVFIDVVINHSSDQHEWFKKSVQRIEPYDTYYVWRDAKGTDKNGKPIPPNNWLSFFKGSAWAWNKERKQFYLHWFHVAQPDLNLRDENVRREVRDILKFWFDNGATGLRMDATPNYIEDDQFRDEPLLNPNVKKTTYTRADYDYIYSQHLWQTYEYLHDLRNFIDDINAKEGGYERVMVVEAWGNLSSTLAYYGTEEYKIAHYPFIFAFALTTEYFTSAALHDILTQWLDNIPKHGVPTWVSENHDVDRLGSRYNSEYATLLNLLVMMLPGVACRYYGQEIGMADGPVRPDQIKEKFWTPLMIKGIRDVARTPMQWDDTINAGFTGKTEPWLPTNPNYWNLNVEAQQNDERSLLNLMRELSLLRKTKTCKYGKFDGYLLSTWVYAFTRRLERHPTFIVIINLGTTLETINLHADIPGLGYDLKVLASTNNSGYKKGEMLTVRPKFPKLFVLRPLSAVVLSDTNNRNLEDTLIQSNI